MIASLWRRPAGVVLAGFALLSLPAVVARPARADDMNRISVLEENDSLYFNSDKHYTQGFRLSNLMPDLTPESGWNGLFNGLADIAPVFSGDGLTEQKRRYAVFTGQSIFTPKNLTLNPPNPRDRPYAGWLYGGMSLLQESNQNTLENLELDLGSVGPAALGEQVQNDWHQFIGINGGQGWKDQIQNEPGGMLSYDRSWRLPIFGDGRSGVDIVPEVGATVGNVMTYGEAGGMIRFGNNLAADYGPVRIRPALSGTDYFDADKLDGNFGYYFFIGTQGRVVGRNIFLDGNSFRQSASIDKKTFVADLEVGLSVFWSSAIRVDFSVERRTIEYVGQPSPDEIGTAAIAFSW